MAFVVHFSPFDGRWVSSPNPKKKNPVLSIFGLHLSSANALNLEQISGSMKFIVSNNGLDTGWGAEGSLDMLKIQRNRNISAHSAFSDRHGPLLFANVLGNTTQPPPPTPIDRPHPGGSVENVSDS